MMLPPDAYIDFFKDATYEELIEERNKLLAFVTDFEKGMIPESEWLIDPAPDVVYQMNLEYLSVLCKRIALVYNRDFIWGERSNEA